MPTLRAFRAFLLPLLAAITLLAAQPAHADGGLSPESELLRPAVRLLAVEFYATWCAPCMEAVPKWKALHDKYREKGLRLVVVAVQDDGRCANVGWSPDRTICDEDGHISDAYRIGQNLPAAFLWSWTGKLLVQRGTVEQVAAAVDAELATLPRVTVGIDRKGADAVALGEVVGLLRSELRKTGKLEVVGSVDEQKLLEDVRRESQKAGYAEKSACKLGEQLAANSLLQASITRTGKEPKLLLQLFSAEKGCLTQSGIAAWKPQNPDLAVAEAVSDLLARLRTEIQMPGAADRPKLPFGGRTVEKAKEVETDDADEAVVDFKSTPEGAMVLMGDKPLCQTPCSKGVPLGTRTISMLLTEYVTKTESVNVRADTKTLQWSLAPDYAQLTVECGAAGLDVKLDGKAWGKCPQRERRVPPGKHTVTLDAPCFLRVEEKLQLERGAKKALTLPADPRIAALTLKAHDDKGNDLRGVASVDGVTLGEVPGSFKVPMCSKKLEVRHPQLGVWSSELSLKEGDKQKLVAEFQSTRLEISADEPGVRVRVDGAVVGRTPVVAQVTPGPHTVDVDDECFTGKAQRVEINQGDRRGVKLSLRQTRANCQRVSQLHLSGLDADDAVRIDGQLRRSPNQLEVPAGKPLKLTVQRAGFGPWHMELTLEPGETRDVQVAWRTVEFIGLEAGDRLLADAEALRVDGAQVQLQEWPSQLVWRRGSVSVPLPPQRGDRVRLPAVLQVRTSLDGLVFRLEGDNGPGQSVTDDGVVLFEPSQERRGRFELRGYTPRPQLLGTVQAGQVLELRLREGDFTIHPEWDRYLGRQSARTWSKAAVWTGGALAVAAGALFVVGTYHQSQGNSATARYNAATDTAGVTQARLDATSAYASAATWKNASIGVGAAGGALILSGVGMLLGLPALPEPGVGGE